MPDLMTLFTQRWQRQLQPLLQRLSIRVTSRGRRWVMAWALWVIIYSLLALLPMVGVDPSGLAMLLTLGHWVALIATGALAIMLLLDYGLLLKATTTRGLAQLHIHRHTQSNLSVQSWSTVTLTLYHPNPAKVTLHLIDYYPTIAQSRYLPITIDSHTLSQNTPIQGNEVNENNAANTVTQGCDIRYELYPTERGIADFMGVDMLISTPLGLLSKYQHIPEDSITGIHQVRVLANFADLVQGNLLGIAQKSAVSGLLKQRRKGQGQDFHQIRNYSEGDSIRHLDWKATARYQRLMTREFQDERDQQIMFLLDCGQHMRHIRFFDETLYPTNNAPSLTGSHLDQALNAMLLLAEVANAQGDATGFISFASENDKVIPPKKGQQVISYLLNQSVDIQPSMLSPDYIAVAKTTRRVQKRRALLILITNTRQEDHTELTEALKLLSAKHIVILANLYEQDMQDYLATLPVTTDDALTYHTVQEYLAMREKLHRTLTDQTHIYTVHCTPKTLPAKLINQYLAIKQKHRL